MSFKKFRLFVSFFVCMLSISCVSNAAGDSYASGKKAVRNETVQGQVVFYVPQNINERAIMRYRQLEVQKAFANLCGVEFSKGISGIQLFANNEFTVVGLQIKADGAIANGRWELWSGSLSRQVWTDADEILVKASINELLGDAKADLVDLTQVLLKKAIINSRHRDGIARIKRISVFGTQIDVSIQIAKKI